MEPTSTPNRQTLFQVTEESLATFFADCGTVMDCRICGDPNSAMRFAFIEFAEDVAAHKVGAFVKCAPQFALNWATQACGSCCVERSACLPPLTTPGPAPPTRPQPPPRQALSKTGSILGSSPLRVLPSKTAIVPVNKELMPRTGDELERCSRTVYVANIDKKVEKEDVRSFFEQLCGESGPGGWVWGGVMLNDGVGGLRMISRYSHGSSSSSSYLR